MMFHDELQTAIGRLRPKLVTICRRLTHDDALGEDLAHEAIVKVLSRLESLPEFYSADEFLGYLAATARNAFRDRLRHAKFESRDDAAEPHQPTDTRLADLVTTLIDMNRLQPFDKTVLLRHIEGDTLDTIRASLGAKSINKVVGALKRSRDFLGAGSRRDRVFVHDRWRRVVELEAIAARVRLVTSSEYERRIQLSDDFAFGGPSAYEAPPDVLTQIEDIGSDVEEALEAALDESHRTLRGARALATLCRLPAVATGSIIEKDLLLLCAKRAARLAELLSDSDQVRADAACILSMWMEMTDAKAIALVGVQRMLNAATTDLRRLRALTKYGFGSSKPAWVAAYERKIGLEPKGGKEYLFDILALTVAYMEARRFDLALLTIQEADDALSRFSSSPPAIMQDYLYRLAIEMIRRVGRGSASLSPLTVLVSLSSSQMSALQEFVKPAALSMDDELPADLTFSSNTSTLEDEVEMLAVSYSLPVTQDALLA